MEQQDLINKDAETEEKQQQEVHIELDTEELKQLLNDEVDKKFGDYANIALPDPHFAHYYEDRSNRILFIEDEITEDTIEIVNEIIRFNLDDYGIPAEKRAPIWLYIHSPGGLLVESTAIADAIYNSKTPVYGINIGECASGAAFIYASCHKRFAYPNAYFLLHLGSGGTYGTFQQTKAQQRHYEHQVYIMYTEIAKRLGVKEIDIFNHLIDSEWYLYANENDLNSEHCAKRFGLITDELNNVIIEN